ncbi:MAG: SDR family oxidoreductase [Acholeplasmatales bacterium]|nr:SDR family oxidoreductase [Acholeplasmatales bacterium]
MKVLITGSSSGIGKAAALKFLANNHEVYGLDLKEATIENPNYHHIICDISNKNSLPEIEGIEILFNNAGLQNSIDDIDNNLKGTIYVTEKYAFQDKIKSVLFNASASAVSGFEFPEYVASKAGVVGYMKNVATRLVRFKATANSISLGGVDTELNKAVMEDKKLWNQIMDVTPLKKWMSVEEVSEWVYFLTVINKSMSGQDLLIDNGEYNLNSTFVWPNYSI